MFPRMTLRAHGSGLFLFLLFFIGDFIAPAPANSPPVAVDDNYTVHAQIDIAPPGILTNDSDPDGDQIHVDGANGSASQTPHGVVIVWSDGTMRYTPNYGFVGTDTISYRACDIYNACSGYTTVTFNVMNSAPVALNDTYTVHRTITASAPGLIGNDSDPDGDGFTIDLPSGQGQYGTTQGGSIWIYGIGNFTYNVPTAPFVGTDTFQYRVKDSLGLISSYATVTFNVVNSPPTLTDEGYGVFGPVLTVDGSEGFLANDSDPEGDVPIVLQAESIETGGTPHGSITTYGNGSFSYHPNAGYVGTDAFAYSACDSLGLCSDATAYFFVTGEGQSAGPASCNANVGAPINVSNGNMYLQQADYTLPAAGPRINVTRTYNSIIQAGGLFGTGWTSDFDESVSLYDNNLLRLNFPDGGAVYFGRTNTGSAFTPVTRGFFGQATKNGNGGYTVTFKNGDVHQFNSSGRLVSMADLNNNQTSFTYNGGSMLVSVTDPFGRVLTVTPDAFGRVLQIGDSMGVVATYVYNGNDLHAVTYADNSSFNLTYTTIGSKRLLTSVADALGNIVEAHTYDSLGRALTSNRHGGVELYTLSFVSATETDVTDALGRVSKYFFDTSKGRGVVTRVEGICGCGDTQTRIWTYDNDLNVTATTNALGQQSTFTYDATGNRLTATDVLGTTTYTYNQFGQVLTRTDVMGGVTTNTYDANSNLLTSKDALNNTTTLTYDTRGRVLTVTDARGKATTFTYTGGNLTRRTDALGNQTNLGYDTRGRLTNINNALNQTTTYGHDAAGRINRVTYPDTLFIAFTYDLAGRRTQVTDARGNTTTYGYDAAYRLTSETDALGHATSYAYNLMSLMTGRTDALGRTTNYEYDDFNRLKKTIYPAASAGATRLEERLEYDANGNIRKRVDTAGRETVFDYDSSNRLIRTTDPAIQITQWGYNARSQVTTVTDGLNQGYSFAYDALGSLTQTSRAGVSMTFEYDAVGNRTKRTDYNGTASVYSYDDLNRLTTITYKVDASLPTDPTAIPTVFTYDALSRLKTASNEAGTVMVNYDVRGRVSSMDDVWGQTISYGYDGNSNRTQMSLGSTLGASYQYDAANRLTQLTDNVGAVFGFGYDATNKLTSRTLPNSINSTLEYDGLDRLTRLKHIGASSTISDFQYQYNTASQITQIAETADSRNFLYDAVDRLTSATYTAQPSESYSYDAVGNRTSSHLSSTYTYQPFNKLITSSTASFTYDNNGNMTRRTDPAGAWQYFWDAENRLVRVVKPGPGPLSYRTFVYRYDALGRRVTRLAKRGGTTNFTYDGQDVVLDTNSTGSTTTYVNGPGIDNKLKQTSSVTGTLYYLQDHLGSTRALTDSSGNVSTQVNYDAYGNTTANSLTRYGYTGRELDPDTGLMYYRARWYDPRLGRFISEDPIGFNGGVNWYSYVGNNPLRYRDPFGLTGEEVLQNPQILGGLAALIAAGGPYAIGGAAVGTLWVGSWYVGESLAAKPWNPFVNGPLNPFGTPELPYYPLLPDLSKGRCELPPTKTPPLIPPVIPPLILNIQSPKKPPTPSNPADAPGPGWVWKGSGLPGTGQGAWNNPDTNESLHPDLSHQPPIGPHWDYVDPIGGRWRIFPDGRMEPK